MAQLPDAWKKITTAVLVIALAVCNLAPFPTPPYILRKNQQKKLMTSAVDFIQKNVPRNATLVSDFEGGLLLGRYLCQKWIVPQDPFSDKFADSECNYRQTMVPPQHLWHFEDTNFASAWRQITADFNSHNDQEVWLFQAGWIDDKQDRWITTLRQYGCVEPHNFGSDIFLCRLDATLK